MSPIQQYWPHDLVPGGAVNCRPGDEDVSDLVASIQAHGLLQPLVGRLSADETVEIIDGNRRLKALRQLFDAGTVTERVDVVLREEEPDADAFEISLAANVLRKPLHPVAEFEAFASLAERGKTTEDIAAHFGITLRQVEQRQALGRLHPGVRAAWLEGRINGEAARAFTLATPDEQASYLAEVLASRQEWRLRPGDIRQAFTQESVPANRPIALFVGEEAYRAAGGEMVRDLFADRQAFADGGLLQRLAGDKLAAVAAEIKAEEGWGEVVFGPDAQDRYMWDRLPKPALPESEKPPRRIEIEARLREIDERSEALQDELEALGLDLEDEDEPTPEVAALLLEEETLDAERHRLSQEHAEYDDERAAWLQVPEDKRAKAIATLEIDANGLLRVQRGYLKKKPGAKAEQRTAMARPEPKPAATGASEAPEPTRLSAALMDDLALTATRAAAHVLAAEPRIALAAFVATHATWGTPIRLTSNGCGEGPELAWAAREHHTKLAFSEAFRAALVMPIEGLQLQAAHMIARMLDFTSKALAYHSYDSLKPEAVTELRAALPAEAHRAALVQAFDAEAYFKAVPKPEAIAAIADCGDEPAKHAKLKKGDLAAVAARLAKERAWLPPLLRGDVFDAILPVAADEPEPDAAPIDETPAQAHLSAAEAAMQIWQDQDGPAGSGPAGPPAGDEEAIPPAKSAHAGDGYEELKAPALRELLKTAGVKVPFGSTREALVQLLRDSERGPVSEAA